MKGQVACVLLMAVLVWREGPAQEPASEPTEKSPTVSAAVDADATRALPASPPLSEDERAELERLRRQSAEWLKNCLKGTRRKTTLTSRLSKTPTQVPASADAGSSQLTLGTPGGVGVVGDAPKATIQPMTSVAAAGASERIHESGFAELAVTLPLPAVHAGIAPKPIVHIDVPTQVEVGKPFSVIARIDRAMSEEVASAVVSNMRRTTITSGVPMPLGTAVLTSIDAAATIQGATQEFFVPPGFSATRAWTVIANRPGTISLNLNFADYPGLSEATTFGRSTLDIEVGQGRSLAWWLLIIAAVVLGLVTFLLGWLRGRRRSETHHRPT